MQFITHDINLAAFLRTKNQKCEVYRTGKRGEFKFELANTDLISAFYNNDGDFLMFGQCVRALKSQIMNLTEVKNA